MEGGSDEGLDRGLDKRSDGGGRQRVERGVGGGIGQ